MKNDPTAPKGHIEVTTAICVRAGNFFGDGWLLMLVFGVLHASAKGVPAFGYWQSTFAAWVVAGLSSGALTPLDARVKKLGQMIGGRS